MDIGSQADAYDNEYRGGRALRFSLNAKAALADGTFACLVSTHKKCMIVCFPVYFEIYFEGPMWVGTSRQFAKNFDGRLNCAFKVFWLNAPSAAITDTILRRQGLLRSDCRIDITTH